MKHYLILILLSVINLLFISCSKNDFVDYGLPIYAELPLNTYSLEAFEDEHMKAIIKDDLLGSDPFIINSDAELQTFLNKIEELLDRNFSINNPEYTSFDFSKYTVILKPTIQAYQPDEIMKEESRFYSCDYMAEDLREEGYFYYYTQRYLCSGSIKDDVLPSICLSGIVVDKIPEGEKIKTFITLSVSEGWGG